MILIYLVFLFRINLILYLPIILKNIRKNNIYKKLPKLMDFAEVYRHRLKIIIIFNKFSRCY